MSPGVMLISILRWHHQGAARRAGDHGRKAARGQWYGWHDNRIVMALIVAGFVAKGTRIDAAEAVGYLPIRGSSR